MTFILRFVAKQRFSLTPESTKPVAEKDGQDGKEMGINRESGSERAAALSRTFLSLRVPPELTQPLNGMESEGLLTLLPAQL